LKKKRPCKFICQKCGSDNVARFFAAKGCAGNESDNWEGLKNKQNEFIKIDYRYWIAKKDCLIHTCIVCHYSWETDVWDGK
jgi:hypothetical protein